MKHLPIDVLRSFVAVIELGGYTQAGELLGRSQPAISLQIKRLEELTNRTLLQRKGQKIALTESGKLLFDFAKKILRLNDEAIAHFDHKALSGRLRLGIPSEFATTLLPSIVSQFSQDYPNISLEVSSSLSHSLKDKRLDFDVILALANHAEEGDTSVIGQDDLVWVKGRDSVIGDPVALVSAPDGCIYRKRMLNVLSAHEIGCRIVYTIADLAGISAALQSGLGITALARSTVPKELEIIDEDQGLPDLGHVSVQVLMNEAKVSPAADKLAEYLKSGLKG